MKNFTLDAFVKHLNQIPREFKKHQVQALEHTGKELVKEIKEEVLGEYQASIGPIPAWEQLEQSTQSARKKAGYTPNDPLLRSGELKDSIQYDVDGDHNLQVGSNKDYAIFLEMGTDDMPPRPFIGAAYYKKIDEIVAEVAVITKKTFD